MTADPLSNGVSVMQNDVLDWLRAQRSLYVKLESVASRQRSLITGDRPAVLLGLLAERQGIASELAALSKRLEPVWRDWKQYRLSMSEPQRDDAESLVDEIRTRMRKVMKSDEEDARLLMARKEATARSLKSTHSGARAISAYRSAPTESLRLDHVEEAS